MQSTCSNAVTTLGEIASVRLGVAFRSRLEHEPAGDVAVLQMKDVSESAGPSYSGTVRVALPNERKDFLLQAGDLVFRSRGRSTGVALVGDDVPPAIIAAPLLLIRPKNVLPGFLHWYLNSDHAQAQLASVAVGTSVQMISAESLRALQIPLPSEHIQRRIAEIAQLIRREEELTSAISMRRKQLATHILMNYAYDSSKGETR